MRYHTGLREGMQLFAPAKINLSLKILGRRGDGFHEIDTLMTPISLHDELTIAPNDSATGLAFSCADEAVPRGEENLVVRAARRFFCEIEAEPKVRITLQKKIPLGAGLGGGSSDAASTLSGLNELHGAPLSLVRLTTIAAEIGSDVPFFLACSAARCRGRGENVGPVPNLPKLPLLLLKPDFGVATVSAYRHWLNSCELPDVDYGPRKLADLVFENDLERPVFEKHLFLALVKSWLARQPEVALALLSGSGSTIFAVLRGRSLAQSLAERAKRELDPELWTCSCETI
jgi:4-diphosphocytidyl-2-C-methyl-D-erythritol kinase